MYRFFSFHENIETRLLSFTFFDLCKLINVLQDISKTAKKETKERERDATYSENNDHKNVKHSLV